MKVKLGKKEYNNKKGFALLFSVLVSSLLLTIGLSIFSIALKELAISTASRQSIHAFYAADSGREYALYRDTKIKNGFFTYLGGSSWTPDSLEIKSTDPDVNITDLGQPNFKIVISKSKTASATKIDTTITSSGYDTDSGDRVERAIEQNY
jgi:hypothetical protein